ncbi:hypothetical protein CU669_17240 [Paramagnetospirillum kuznetsovii]|uniref:Uncharacterized protein n=1 Tax=Paramagnetospirillum kuznetsovii TaxID=2053833 RepID=A0A364NUV2_9PROT|nr:hypothetical protein [Paramagnetospirillum kuznetsovii]RAU20685.1 hypothetical protein CU669_17240 [Paramagnetospirillum kuznetsovii]
MGTIYVAKSKALQTWGADVGLGKNTVYKIGFLEDGDAAEMLAAGLAGVTDWELIKTQDAEGVTEQSLLERLARKEKLVDPNYYPKIKGAQGLVKVDLVKVENSMRIRIALETNQEPKTLKVKPTDIAQYLINNALG